MLQVLHGDEFSFSGRAAGSGVRSDNPREPLKFNGFRWGPPRIIFFLSICTHSLILDTIDTEDNALTPGAHTIWNRCYRATELDFFKIDKF